MTGQRKRVARPRTMLRKLVGGLAVSLVMLLLLLGCGELLVRVFGDDPLPKDPTYFELDLYHDQHVMHSRTFWQLRPNNKAWQVNAEGFRTVDGGSVPRRKPAGEFRLAFMGDSAVFGWGDGKRAEVIDAKFAFPHQVQLRLNRSAGGGTIYRALNFGVPGYTTFQGLARLEQLVLDYQPDLVLTYFGTNDQGIAHVSDATRARIFPWRRQLRRSRLGQAFSKLMRPPRGPRAQGPPTPELLVGVPRVSAPEYADNLARMARLVRQRGGRLVVLSYLYNTRDEGPGPLADKGVVTIDWQCLRPDGLFFDLVGPMRRQIQGGADDLYFDACHPTAKGHAIVADTIVDHLRRSDLLPSKR